jgi:hypothetical protein
MRLDIDAVEYSNSEHRFGVSEASFALLPLCVPGDCDSMCKGSNPPCKSGQCISNICVCKDCGSAAGDSSQVDEPCPESKDQNRQKPFLSGAAENKGSHSAADLFTTVWTVECNQGAQPNCGGGMIPGYCSTLCSCNSFGNVQCRAANACTGQQVRDQCVGVESVGNCVCHR